jgi:hypothetical protein
VAGDLAWLEETSPAAVEEALVPITREMLAAGFLERRT